MLRWLMSRYAAWGHQNHCATFIWASLRVLGARTLTAVIIVSWQLLHIACATTLQEVYHQLLQMTQAIHNHHLSILPRPRRLWMSTSVDRCAFLNAAQEACELQLVRISCRRGAQAFHIGGICQTETAGNKVSRKNHSSKQVQLCLCSCVYKLKCIK